LPPFCDEPFAAQYDEIVGFGTLVGPWTPHLISEFVVNKSEISISNG